MFGVELRRFLWRRSFRVFGLIGLAGIIFAAVTTFVVSDSADPFRLTSLVDIFKGTSVPLIILGLAFGASFIGAEWNAQTLTTLLTWEPRRSRVILAKMSALFVAVGISAIVLQVVLGLALVPAALWRGSTSGADSVWLVDAAEVIGRGALIASLMSLLGFALAGIARNTTITLIIGFVYFAIGEAILRGLKPEWQEWLIGDNAAAFVGGDPTGIFGFSTTRTVGSSLLVVVMYAAMGAAIVTASFNKRDVA